MSQQTFLATAIGGPKHGELFACQSPECRCPIFSPGGSLLYSNPLPDDPEGYFSVKGYRYQYDRIWLRNSFTQSRWHLAIWRGQDVSEGEVCAYLKGEPDLAWMLPWVECDEDPAMVSYSGLCLGGPFAGQKRQWHKLEFIQTLLDNNEQAMSYTYRYDVLQSCLEGHVETCEVWVGQDITDMQAVNEWFRIRDQQRMGREYYQRQDRLYADDPDIVESATRERTGNILTSD